MWWNRPGCTDELVHLPMQESVARTVQRDSCVSGRQLAFPVSGEAAAHLQVDVAALPPAQLKGRRLLAIVVRHPARPCREAAGRGFDQAAEDLGPNPAAGRIDREQEFVAVT